MHVKNLTIDRIQTAFSPAREIQDPNGFAGRKEEIKLAVSGLLNAGGFLVIFGLRGVGKSSIAHQIKLIAEGDLRLVRSLSLERMIPKRGFNFMVHYIRCDGFVRTVPDLLKRILFGDDTNPSLFSLTANGERRLKEFKRAIEAEGGVDIFAAKIGTKGTEEKTFEFVVTDDLIQQFRQLIGSIKNEHQDRTGLLVLVDEFDTIRNKSGFASIVKACSSDFVKFGVIGIAGSVSELIADHGSIGRQIDFVPVDRMRPEELALIIRKAEVAVDEAIIFKEAATNYIIEASAGFPYFTHFLGREAMLLSFQQQLSVVSAAEAKALSEMVMSGRVRSIYEDVYQSAVKHSPQREILLKLFSEVSDDEVEATPVYASAKSLGITNPSQLMKELTTPARESEAPILIRIRESYFRFSDPGFKVYARLRNWKY